MKKNERSLSDAPVSRASLSSINRNIAAEKVENLGQPDDSVAARLMHMLMVFSVIRPLLVLAASVQFLPPASRTALSVFVQSVDALSILTIPADEDEVQDFKAGRDLEE